MCHTLALLLEESSRAAVHKMRQRLVDELTPDLLAEIFDGVADFAPTSAEAFLHGARRLVGDAFFPQLFIVVHVRDAFLHTALHAFRFSSEFILVPHVSLPV
jgi:hypothetical protein